MKFLVKLSYIVLLVSYSNIAQEIKVLTKSNRQPIPDVILFVKGTSKNVQTDFDGKADISVFKDSDIITFTHSLHHKKQILKTKISSLGNTILLEANENELSEVVISIAKWKQERKDVSQKVVSLSSNEIQRFTPQTSADLLQNSGQVFVQKSQLGGGSPMIRGFSTNRLLITVDGVRMNTAIFRGGNIQNIISIDPFIVESSEVILGPGSVAYGSDAIGGVMSFFTKQPKFDDENSKYLKLNTATRYATANNEKTAHLDVTYRLNKFSFLSSISYTDFDDLKMGSHGPDDYLRNTFVQTINGTDQVIENSNPKKQIATGYDQLNLLQKIYYKPHTNWSFNLGLLYSSTSNYPRYDRLIRMREDNFRSASWFYGPQQWFMGTLHAHHMSNSKIFDQLKVTSAYQFFEESRNDRDFNSNILQQTKENVHAYSLNLDFEKEINSRSTLYYGLEYVLNQVFSEGNSTDISTENQIAAPSRYPDGATWQSIASFANLKYRFNKKLRFQGGFRYNRIILYSNFDDQFFDFPFTEANLDTDALTGSAGFSWLPNQFLQWRLNFSTAFRAPNIDDIGKIFESEPGAVVVPNPTLKSEYAHSFELGVKLTIAKKMTIDFATYFTDLDNALVRSDFNLNGESQIIYRGVLSNVQAIQNASSSRIYGFEGGLQYKLSNKFKFLSYYTIVGGNDRFKDATKTPSRHVSPQFGNTNLILNLDRWTIDIFANYNGTLKFNDLAPSQQNNAFLYAKDKNGNPYAPAWYTLNMRTQFKFNDNLKCIFSVENITDQRYRPYASGIAAPGRNFIISLLYTR